MPLEVRLPQVAESMGSAKIAVWLKTEGDVVEASEVIAEIETDKVTVELQAPGSGVLGKILVPAGISGLSVGQLLVVIQDVAEIVVPVSNQQQSPIDVRFSDRVLAVASERSDGSAGTATAVEADGEAMVQSSDSRAPDSGVTPLARRISALMGVDLASIRGTGLNGRIRRQDVEQGLSENGSPGRRMPPSRSSAAIVPFDSPSVSFEERRPTAMRSITAERLTFSKQTIPHFYLTIECDADPLLAAKKAVNDHGSNRLTLTDFVVRASALALVKVPAANSAWVDGSVRVYSSCDIAVAVNTPAGLIAPVVRDAQTKGVVTISRELKELAERARNGQLSKQDYTGGTFTISNLGMFGVSSLYAIVNPPQSCILGIGKVQRLPVVRDEQIVIGDIMTCTLSADHRALDGVIGAELLSEFRRYIEDPWLMVF